MATFVVTGDLYRKINRGMREIKRQLDQDEGSPFDPELVADVLQRIVEGKFESDFLLSLKAKTEDLLSQRFGKKIEVDDPPSEFTEENLKKWEKLGFKPIFLPDEEISEDRKLKNWVKPEKWFYQKIKEGKISSDATKLRRGWYLADFSVSVNYTDGTQVFPSDPLTSIISKLRTEGKVGKYEKTPIGSRFVITPEEWENIVCPAVLEESGIDSQQAICTLERAIEFNAIGNLYDPNRGRFNMWEWFHDPFEDSNRLYGGHSGHGGLAGVHCYWVGDRDDRIAGRPLVSFAK